VAATPRDPRSRGGGPGAAAFFAPARAASVRFEAVEGAGATRAVVQATAGVTAVRDGTILLVRRADDGSWCLPGGRVEIGESIVACAERECLEETGYRVRVTSLVGVYSDPGDQTHRYPDGTVVQFVNVVFDGVVGDDPPAPLAGDTVEVRWCAAEALPEPLMATDAPIIRDRLRGRDRPVVA